MPEDLITAKHYFDLGLKALTEGDPGTSEEHFLKSLEFAPNRVSILINLTFALIQQKKWLDAIHHCNTLLTIHPTDIDGLINLGVCYQKTGDRQKALMLIDRAIEINSQSSKAWVNKGNIMQEEGLLSEARSCFEAALKIDSKSIEALIGLGNLHAELKNYQLGLQYLSRAYEIDPENCLVQWNKSIALLRLGNFKEGWKLYESRWKAQSIVDSRKYQNIPLWMGESLGKKTILIYSEQGFGDAIQMSRYLPLLHAERGANVIFEVPNQLYELMKSLGPEIEILQTNNLEAIKGLSIDFQCPIMSLPLAFNTDLQSIPSKTPYLHPDRQKAKKWKQKLQLISMGTPTPRPFRIGITWQGSGHYAGIKNTRRDAPTSLVNSLVNYFLDYPVEFHALQKFKDNNFWNPKKTNLFFHGNQLETFAETAALVSELDLIISVDTATGHLSGALGKDTLLLIPDPPDFMSLIDVAESPWYPNTKFIRQSSKGSWSEMQLIDAILDFLPRQ